jgi:predicted FMN-binding regulatory protein PaiB
LWNFLILENYGEVMQDELGELLSKLSDAQKELIVLTAKTNAFPDNNTLRKIATLALNISAVEGLIADTQSRAKRAKMTKAND